MTQGPSRHRSGGQKAWHGGRWSLKSFYPFHNGWPRGPVWFLAPFHATPFFWRVFGWRFGWGCGMAYGKTWILDRWSWKVHMSRCVSFKGNAVLSKASLSQSSEFVLWQVFMACKNDHFQRNLRWLYVKLGNFSNDMRWYLTWTTSRKDHIGRKPTRGFPQKKEARTAAWWTFHWQRNRLQKSVRKSGMSYWISCNDHVPACAGSAITMQNYHVKAILCRKLNDPWRYSLKHPSWKHPSLN